MTLCFQRMLKTQKIGWQEPTQALYKATRKKLNAKRRNQSSERINEDESPKVK